LEKTLAEMGYTRDEQPSDAPARTRKDPMLVRLDTDVAAVFTDDEMVNRALRKLIRIMSMVEEKKSTPRPANDH
jgi:hypothetical protein